MAIDSRLKWLLAERSEPSASLLDAITTVEGGPSADVTAWQGPGPKPVDVVVGSAPAVNRIAFESYVTNCGMEIHGRGGTDGRFTVTGSIDVDRLEALNANPLVARVESPRDIQPELLDSLPACTAMTAHKLVPPARGAKAFVGVIDRGIDHTRPVFKNAGKTRIWMLWDQSAPTPSVGGTVPYGLVYTAADIDAGRAAAHTDPIGHGTHIASIAAGAAPRDGVAPEADLIVVSLGSAGGQTLGKSKNAIDAFDWIVKTANAARRPVAINMSQGMNGGGHVGSSLLEIAMDAHCRARGVALIKSAGNEQEWRIHASGTIPAGGVLTLEVVCQPGKQLPGALEIWFDARDDVEIQIQPPTGGPTLWVNRNASVPATFQVARANSVRVDVERDPEGTGDDLWNVFFAKGSSAIGLAPGTWRILLRATTIGAGGRIDAWLERTARNPRAEQLRFSTASNDSTCTISIPGTSRRVVTVGSYVTRPEPQGSSLIGALSRFSSRGPTRCGVRKPDLVAPGEWINAARSAKSSGAGAWISMQGTSMAAPHVTGAAAILLAQDPSLTGEEVRQILTRTARVTPSSPDDSFGFGMLDVEAAIILLRQGRPPFPVVTGAKVMGTVFEITTQASTTASLLYDANAGRVMAGRRTGSLPSLSPGMTHRFNLTAAGSGLWHFEVHLFASGWRTIADNNGQPWSITV
jgi:subtilisin family serine protease